MAPSRVQLTIAVAACALGPAAAIQEPLALASRLAQHRYGAAPSSSRRGAHSDPRAAAWQEIGAAAQLPAYLEEPEVTPLMAEDAADDTYLAEQDPSDGAVMPESFQQEMTRLHDPKRRRRPKDRRSFGVAADDQMMELAAAQQQQQQQALDESKEAEYLPDAAYESQLQALAVQGLRPGSLLQERAMEEEEAAAQPYYEVPADGEVREMAPAFVEVSPPAKAVHPPVHTNSKTSKQPQPATLAVKKASSESKLCGGQPCPYATVPIVASNTPMPQPMPVLAPAEAASTSCTPQCTWKCDSPQCDEVCQPECEAPRCETRCGEVDLNSCSFDCNEADCATHCPERQCPTQECAECQTTCSTPQCHLSCPGPQPCRRVCEQPQCHWKCRAPEHCPEPNCVMMCEHPKDCMGDTYESLPPLTPGETAVQSFAAPSFQPNATSLTQTGRAGAFLQVQAMHMPKDAPYRSQPIQRILSVPLGPVAVTPGDAVPIA